MKCMRFIVNGIEAVSIAVSCLVWRMFKNEISLLSPHTPPAIVHYLLYPLAFFALVTGIISFGYALLEKNATRKMYFRIIGFSSVFLSIICFLTGWLSILRLYRVKV